jgi:hypothetical protein
MKRLILTCKKATYFISLKEEGRLTFIQRIQLRIHIAVCVFCRLFEKQAAFFTKNAVHLQDHCPAPLSREAKESMRKVIKAAISGE